MSNSKPDPEMVAIERELLIETERLTRVTLQLWKANTPSARGQAFAVGQHIEALHAAYVAQDWFKLGGLVARSRTRWPSDPDPWKGFGGTGSELVMYMRFRQDGEGAAPCCLCKEADAMVRAALVTDHALLPLAIVHAVCSDCCSRKRLGEGTTAERVQLLRERIMQAVQS
jgi:hypothetical protein